MASAKKLMTYEAMNNTNDYLDSSRCFNCTALAEWYLLDHDVEDEEEIFDLAVDIKDILVKEGLCYE